MIWNIILGLEVASLIVLAYFIGRREAHWSAVKAAQAQADKDMDVLITAFNEALESVYQITGVETPRLPTLKEFKHGRKR